MTSSHYSEKESLIHRICQLSRPDGIYLLGTVSLKRSITSIFTTGAPACHYTAHYFLLVLESSGAKTHEVQEGIESGCKPLVPVSAIVLKTAEFSHWASESHPFAATVLNGAEIWYSSSSTSFPAISPPNKGAQAASARTICNTNAKRAAAFLAGADLFRIRTEYGMAAFMLHQAVECMLRTALHVLTGYYYNTHSLDKLSRYGSFLLWRLPEIWEHHKPAGEALFSLLQRAYVEPRYKDGYKISATELESLFTKVHKLNDHLKEAILNNLVEVS